MKRLATEGDNMPNSGPSGAWGAADIDGPLGSLLRTVTRLLRLHSMGLAGIHAIIAGRGSRHADFWTRARRMRTFLELTP
jgi:hypothetical protein